MGVPICPHSMDLRSMVSRVCGVEVLAIRVASGTEISASLVIGCKAVDICRTLLKLQIALLRLQVLHHCIDYSGWPANCADAGNSSECSYRTAR